MRYIVKQSPDRMDVFEVYDNKNRVVVAGKHDQETATMIADDWNFEDSLKIAPVFCRPVEMIEELCK